MADKGPSRLTAAAALAGTEFVHVIQGQTCTITIASPGVVTATSHGKAENDQVIFSTTGALPTGLAVDTVYYVRNPAANTFEVSATSGGSSINTSGTQSGTHTVFGNSRRATTQDVANLGTGFAIADTTGLQAALDAKLDDSQAGATGLSVLGAASEAAARAAIGAVIGTDVQAFDADLAAIAALTTTSYGRALLELANQAALMALIDYATAAEIRTGTASAVAIAPDQLVASAAPQTLTDGATVNWDMASGYNAKVTLGGDRTMAAPTNPKVGLTYVLEVIQDGTGTRLVTWNAAFKWGSAGTPTLSTTAGKRDLVSLYCYDAATPEFRAIFSKDA